MDSGNKTRENYRIFESNLGITTFVGIIAVISAFAIIYDNLKFKSVNSAEQRLTERNINLPYVQEEVRDKFKVKGGEYWLGNNRRDLSDNNWDDLLADCEGGLLNPYRQEMFQLVNGVGEIDERE